MQSVLAALKDTRDVYIYFVNKPFLFHRIWLTCRHFPP